MRWPDRRFTDLLGIEHPIVQAPMAGASTPELAAAVSAAGGLGSLGCVGMDADELREVVGAIRAHTDRPFNLNFFTHPRPVARAEAVQAMRARVAPFYQALGLGTPAVPSEPYFRPFDEGALEVLLELRVPVASFHFGLPSRDAIAALRSAGAVTLCTATTVDEARAIEHAGIDVVVAQGWEAGGHRGTFEVSDDDYGVGTLALIPQVVDAVHIPVIAAGGIADGRGIAAAFALGACGVQVGTAFLSCPEARVSDAHRAALRDARATDTRLTRAFTGRPARAKRVRYVELMRTQEGETPDFPLPMALSAPLRASGDPDYQFLLYGQAASIGREVPAAELMATLTQEARAALAKLA